MANNWNKKSREQNAPRTIVTDSKSGGAEVVSQDDLSRRRLVDLLLGRESRFAKNREPAQDDPRRYYGMGYYESGGVPDQIKQTPDSKYFDSSPDGFVDALIDDYRRDPSWSTKRMLNMLGVSPDSDDPTMPLADTDATILPTNAGGWATTYPSGGKGRYKAKK